MVDNEENVPRRLTAVDNRCILITSSSAAENIAATEKRYSQQRTEPGMIHGIEPLLEPEEVAAICKVPKATVYAWSSRGDSGLQFIRVGRHLRVRPADLERWLDEQAAARSA